MSVTYVEFGDSPEGEEPSRGVGGFGDDGDNW